VPKVMMIDDDDDDDVWAESSCVNQLQKVTK